MKLAIFLSILLAICLFLFFKAEINQMVVKNTANVVKKATLLSIKAVALKKEYRTLDDPLELFNLSDLKKKEKYPCILWKFPSGEKEWMRADPDEYKQTVLNKVYKISGGKLYD